MTSHADDPSTDIQFEPSSGEIAHFELTVVRGVDVGRAIRLDETRPLRALIGQGSSCDLRLTDRRVSRRHLTVEVRGDLLRVIDLMSSNGTTVAGIRVGEIFLRGGEHLMLGETTLEVTRLLSTPDAAVPLSRSLGRIIGSSLEMRRLYPLIERLAGVNAPVLIEGETGTGKELVAETLHQRGPRANGPFIVLDCAALTSEIGASTIFGDSRGPNVTRGVFEQAHGGSLLLDEVGEIAPDLQPLLLRAIERGEVQRRGDDRALAFDVRVIATTRHDLDRAVQDGRFREDLFFRLAMARLELPPLRERRGDVGVLARHFWTALGGSPSQIPYDAIDTLEHSSFQGNVRDLYGAIVRLITLGQVDEKVDAPSSSLLRPFCDPTVPYARAKETLFRAFQREYVEVMVEREGSVQRAAAASGLALRYFQLLRAKQRDRDGQE